MFYVVETEKEADHCSQMSAKADHPSLRLKKKLF